MRNNHDFTHLFNEYLFFEKAQWLLCAEGTRKVMTDKASELCKFQPSREQIGEAPNTDLTRAWSPEGEDV